MAANVKVPSSMKEAEDDFERALRMSIEESGQPIPVQSEALPPLKIPLSGQEAQEDFERALQLSIAESGQAISVDPQILAPLKIPQSRKEADDDLAAILELSRQAALEKGIRIDDEVDRSGISTAMDVAVHNWHWQSDDRAFTADELMAKQIQDQFDDEQSLAAITKLQAPPVRHPAVTSMPRVAVPRAARSSAHAAAGNNDDDEKDEYQGRGLPLQPQGRGDNWVSEPELHYAHHMRLYKIHSHHISSVVCKDTAEFNSACAHFCRLTGKAIDSVTQVECVVYEELSPVLRMYFETKAQFDAAGKGNEHWVFHGTHKSNVLAILQSGFKVGGVDSGVRVANGATYGHGVYTATGPATPMEYSTSSNRVILARGLVGHQQFSTTGPRLGGTQLLAPQPIQLQAWLGYSNGAVQPPVVQPAAPPAVLQAQELDSWMPRNDWMIFKTGQQLLPCYVVHFK